MAEGFKLLDAYVEVKADAGKVAEDAAEQVKAGSGHLESAGSGLGNSMVGGMQGVIGGLVGGIVSSFAYQLESGVENILSDVFQAAKSAVIDYNSQLEQANIGFTTMLGSAGKARSFIDELQVFAKKTPFAFADLTNYAQQMIGYGVNAQKVIPYLTALGDAAAGAGKSSAELGNAVLAFEQISARGKVDLGDLNQLTNAGIPAISILASEYHVTKGALLDMVSAGKLASDQALPKLISGIEHGTKSTAAFGGMMNKQSETLQGAMGNISDAFNQTISTAGLPFFKLIEKIALKIADFAGSKKFSDWANDASKNVGKALGSIQKAVKSVFDDPKLQASIKAFGSAFSKAMGDSAPNLQKILPDLVKFAKDALPGIVSGLTQVVKALPKFTSDLKGTADDLGKDGKAWGKFFSDVGGFISDFVGTLKDMDDWVDRFKKWQVDAKKALYGFIADVGKWASDAIGAFGKWASDTIGTIAGLPGKFQQIGSDIVAGLGRGISNAWGSVTSTVSNLVNSIPVAVRKLLGIASPSKVFQEIGGWVAKGLQKGLLGGVSDVKSASAQIASAIRQEFSDKTITKWTEKAMLSQLQDVTLRLTSIAAKRQKVIDQISAQKDKLTSLKDDRASYKSGIISALSGQGSASDIASLYTAATTTSATAGNLDGNSYQPSYTTSTGGGLAGVRTSLRKLLSDTKTFLKNIKQLVKNGLDKYTVQELLQAGPTAGLPITNDLLADKSSFNDIVSLQKQIASTSTSLGEYGAGYTYDGQIRSTQSAISRLNRQADNITAVMIVEARKIDEVNKVVKAVNALAHTAKAKNAAKKKTVKR